MNFEIKTLGLAQAAVVRADALLVLVPDAFKPEADAISTLIALARRAGDLEGKPGKVLTSFGATGVAARRLVVASCADGSARQLRNATLAAVQTLKSAHVAQLTVCLLGEPGASAVAAVVSACAEATYAYTLTKSKPEGRKLKAVTVGVPRAAAHKAEFERAVAMVQGVEVAKEWGNRPGNHATPSHLADAARSIAKGPRFKCQVLGPKEVAKLGMGSFMAVAQGSAQPLRFIVMEYQGAVKSSAPVVLVGKGITFDTGGISIKPAAEMDEMKFDMCGAASVLGVFAALRALKPAVNVVGLIPTCENMPDGCAIKPGDVVTSMSGQTIEILNTDAEGRLILCDALTYAERYKPHAVVDIATLTGACVIALGAVRSGMFATHDDLADALSAAGERALDPCWRMPLDDEYAEGLKTNFADVANVAGRAAGSVTAAKFLQRFAGKYPWAHLDIAGTAWKGGASKGATGRPVGLLLEYLLGALPEPRSS